MILVLIFITINNYIVVSLIFPSNIPLIYQLINFNQYNKYEPFLFRAITAVLIRNFIMLKDMKLYIHSVYYFS